MSLKCRESWGINQLSGNSVPESEHPVSKEVLPSVQSKLPHVQLGTIPTCPITEYQGEEINTSLSISLPQETVVSNEVFLQPPFLQSRPAYEGFSLPALFLQLCCPPLEAFCGLHILLNLWDPRLGFDGFSFLKGCIFLFLSFHHLSFTVLFSPCSNFFIFLCRPGYTHFYTVAVDLMVLLEGEKLKQ